MKISVLFVAIWGVAVATNAHATSSTIDANNRYAYGANVGWMDFRGDTTNGAVIGEYVCTGYLYSANVGWISLGNGNPVNHIYYQNNAANDFGVNNDGLGNLSGYAYGANIGWVAFETNGAPKVDILTGRMTGSIYSANVGWISLSNAVAYVQTDTLWPGLLDTNGIPFAWEYQNFGVAGINPNADPDNDGQNNYQEYLAGTNPNNGSDYLHITDFNSTPSGQDVNLTWTSHPTRVYFVQKTTSVTPPVTWFDSGLGLVAPSAGTTTSTSFTDSTAPSRLYRVEAQLPLQP